MIANLIAAEAHLSSTYSTSFIQACNSYTWINGTTYYASDSTSTDTTFYITGFFHVQYLDLNISNSTHDTVSILSCDSLTWIDGITYYQSTVAPSIIYTNQSGCDSTVFLDLSISSSTSDTVIISSCVSFTWIDGITYYQSTVAPSITYTSQSGCDSSIFLDLTINAVDTGITVTDFTLSANATNATFQWINCSEFGQIQDAILASYTVSQSGSYAVEVSQNGCIDTSKCVDFINVGISAIDLQENINIYPNPVHDQFKVEITDWPSQKVHIIIRDLSGKIILKQHLDSISNHEVITVNTSQWARGSYFVEISDGVKLINQKLVVQ